MPLVPSTSVVVHSQEENSNCGNNTSGREYDYSLGVVNPSEVDAPSDGGRGRGDHCHCETIQSYAADDTTEDGPQFATIADHPARCSAGWQDSDPIQALAHQRRRQYLLALTGLPAALRRF